MFHRTSPDEESAKKDPEHASRANTMIQEPFVEEPDVKESRPKLTTWKMTVRRLSEMERYRATARGNGASINPGALARERSPLRRTEVGLLQSVEEVWFAGCHADVGGEYPKSWHQPLSLILTVSSTGGTVADDCRYSLADISLRWMVKQVVLSQCGILFDLSALRRADIDISNIVFTDPHQPTVGDYWKRGPRMRESSSPVPDPEDAGEGYEADMWPTDQDALTDSHDQLKSRKVWWMLEMLPMKYAWQDAKGKWHAKWG